MKVRDTHLGAIQEKFHAFYRALIEPTSTGEDERRREFILNIILIGSIAMLLLLDAVVLYYTISWGPKDHGISFWIFSMIPAFFIILLALSRKKLFALASYLLIAAYFLSDSYAVWRWTTDLPAALLGYAAIIMIASILSGTKFGFIVTGAIGLFLVPVGYLQLHGLIASDASWKQNASTTDAMVFAALLFLIMTISWLSNREIEKSLFRARKSERELQHEKDSLEIKVEERTEELQKAQFEKIEQVNRFAEFGQLASGLFHDMLNIMNTLSIQMDIRGEHDDSNLQKQQMASENASATTRQIEQFMQAIRKQLNREEAEEFFSINKSIDQVIQLLSYKAHRESVRIIFEHAEEPELLYFGNPFKFHQIVFNLVMNAIESHANISDKPERDRQVKIQVRQKENTIAVEISDRGCGIPEPIREKIFDPFFTTKTETNGTGIGLASVKKIVEKNFAGTIAVHSVDGNGSAFTIIFPKRVH